MLIIILAYNYVVISQDAFSCPVLSEDAQLLSVWEEVLTLQELSVEVKRVEQGCGDRKAAAFPGNV